MTHAWCRDVPRDLSVRAAEDGRIGPLPTLEDAIWSARAMMPKSVSGSSAPEPENKGHGMRTERITLDVTHDLDAPLGDWIVQVIDESLGFNEYVRVVEECCLDRINMGEVIRERDAAIRERQKAEQRADRYSINCSALADKVLELRARVAELEANANTATVLAKIRESEWSIASELAAEANAELSAAPAASGAADSSGEPKSSEPVAWGIVNELGKRIAVIDEEPSDGWLGCTFVPLYASPPPARGWLTEEEREAVADAAETLALRGCGSERRSRILQSILARSTPPEVVLPPMPDCSPMADYGAAWRDCLVAVREALRRAGVKVQQPLPPEVEGNG